MAGCLQFLKAKGVVLHSVQQVGSERCPAFFLNFFFFIKGTSFLSRFHFSEHTEATDGNV